MKKKDIRVLTVGVGSIGKRHIDNFKNYTKNIDIVDISKARLIECKKRFEQLHDSRTAFDDADNDEYFKNAIDLTQFSDRTLP